MHVCIMKGRGEMFLYTDDLELYWKLINKLQMIVVEDV